MTELSKVLIDPVEDDEKTIKDQILKNSFFQNTSNSITLLASDLEDEDEDEEEFEEEDEDLFDEDELEEEGYEEDFDFEEEKDDDDSEDEDVGTYN